MVLWALGDVVWRGEGMVKVSVRDLHHTLPRKNLEPCVPTVFWNSKSRKTNDANVSSGTSADPRL